MTFTLTIECDNGAFQGQSGERAAEVARILARAASLVRSEVRDGTLLDIDGNTVGHFQFQGARP